ncbi:MAG: hypothetical protein ACTSUE_13610 [Promethearchaeota archaeon]
MKTEGPYLIDDCRIILDGDVYEFTWLRDGYYELEAAGDWGCSDSLSGFRWCSCGHCTAPISHHHVRLRTMKRYYTNQIVAEEGEHYLTLKQMKVGTKIGWKLHDEKKLVLPKYRLTKL